MIIYDENIDGELVKLLNIQAEICYSIQKNKSGINDLQVIDIVRSKDGLLITEDKDFGELVFAHQIKDVSVIFLRYEKKDLVQIVNNIKNVLKEYYPPKAPFFITITPKKVRISLL